ncbi:hypothetical protein NP493_1447g00061 [Ridgeia piscesae]|uniref:Uncharacterized protein n=1 Tax=Ridgeia piscesae TaxID=27915 RepID=A0AAD9K398_RIDPI|nr:hypothetical protein NP493_1447g00061 [Ridgeia piscesae]
MRRLFTSLSPHVAPQSSGVSHQRASSNSGLFFGWSKNGRRISRPVRLPPMTAMRTVIATASTWKPDCPMADLCIPAVTSGNTAWMS